MAAGKKRSASFKRGAPKKKRSGHGGLATTYGHVFVVGSSGAKRNSYQFARKASAREISQTLGLSSRQLSRAKSLIARLEAQGRIAKF